MSINSFRRGSMDKFISKYDVEKTMYQKFEDSAQARGTKPCFHYYNNTISIIDLYQCTLL